MLYQTFGYTRCNSFELESGFQKIAIYTKPSGELDGVPTHVARQLPNGRWTSKLAVCGADTARTREKA
ncbi:hypothetical protein WA1_46890 [Scytonema hofmannii PCC 7110]|uniref:DUF7689 domain-containing protein n=1 Tax=Scytonema hofmannii PCC 7110 TaxID=128403 RepID=A0A139WXJ5_9CYAN|nr:hypothetical protein [Scytonema hofmannii]KYC37161.1 hypothetical protein WA1_46890 [Scytonema hofmannii PCC 7110]